jgi:hypothetical protein
MQANPKARCRQTTTPPYRFQLHTFYWRRGRSYDSDVQEAAYRAQWPWIGVTVKPLSLASAASSSAARLRDW